jgi:hypothetical protein
MRVKYPEMNFSKIFSKKDLVHVEVLVRRQSADEANAGLLLRQGAVLLVERVVGRVGDRIVRVAVGGGVLARDARALSLNF